MWHIWKLEYVHVHVLSVPFIGNSHHVHVHVLMFVNVDRFYCFSDHVYNLSPDHQGVRYPRPLSEPPSEPTSDPEDDVVVA